MNLELKDSVVLLIGAGQGVGKATLDCFSREGAVVSAMARSDENIERCKESILSIDPSSDGVFYVGDAKCEDKMHIFVESVVNKFGRVDVAVCNVGPVQFGSVWDVSSDVWTSRFEENFFPLFNMCSMVVPYMRNVGGGAIINVGSISALQPGGTSTPDHGYFKLGALNWMKQLSNELSCENIRANTVTPGLITPPTEDLGRDLKVRLQSDTVSEAISKYSDSKIPMKRAASSEEVARAIVFIASGAASYITGHNLIVDGGYTRCVA